MRLRLALITGLTTAVLAVAAHAATLVDATINGEGATLIEVDSPDFAKGLDGSDAAFSDPAEITIDDSFEPIAFPEDYLEWIKRTVDIPDPETDPSFDGGDEKPDLYPVSDDALAYSTGIYTLAGGGFTNTSAVPEPTGWAMMILGTAGVGALARSRRGRRAAI